MNNNMNISYPQKRYARGVLGTVLGFIAALTVLSAVLLAVRLVDYVKRDDREIQLKSDFAERLDIFAVQYHNASGEITVSGADEQRVIAPGTREEYTLRLRNADGIAVDYELASHVSYTSEHVIPIRFRMIDSEGNYLIGDAKTWIAIEDMASYTVNGTLVKGDRTEYIFEWKWDYESGDDDYDTFLGSLAREEDFGVEVSFDLRAEANTAIGANGGVRESGLGDIIVAAVALAFLIASVTLMIIYIVKKYKNEHGTDGEQPNWYGGGNL